MAGESLPPHQHDGLSACSHGLLISVGAGPHKCPTLGRDGPPWEFSRPSALCMAAASGLNEQEVDVVIPGSPQGPSAETSDSQKGSRINYALISKDQTHVLCEQH